MFKLFYVSVAILYLRLFLQSISFWLVRALPLLPFLLCVLQAAPTQRQRGSYHFQVWVYESGRLQYQQPILQAGWNRGGVCLVAQAYPLNEGTKSESQINSQDAILQNDALPKRKTRVAKPRAEPSRPEASCEAKRDHLSPNSRCVFPRDMRVRPRGRPPPTRTSRTRNGRPGEPARDKYRRRNGPTGSRRARCREVRWWTCGAI